FRVKAPCAARMLWQVYFDLHHRLLERAIILAGDHRAKAATGLREHSGACNAMEHRARRVFVEMRNGSDGEIMFLRNLKPGLKDGTKLARVVHVDSLQSLP